jgi:hypothetical protein
LTIGAELQVDALTGGLGGDHDLCPVAEIVFGSNAGIHIHRAVDGDHVVAPLAELAQGAALSAVACQVIQRVLELGEDQQLAVAQVGEDGIPQPHQFALRLLPADGLRLSDEPVEFRDLSTHLFDILRDRQLFQARFDLEAFFL